MSVGARVMWSGREGLDGRPSWFVWRRWLVDERAEAPLHPRATIKALPAARQPPSPLRDPGLVLRLMPIDVCRGEGSVEWTGGPLWSPVVVCLQTLACR